MLINIYEQSYYMCSVGKDAPHASDFMVAIFPLCEMGWREESMVITSLSIWG